MNLNVLALLTFIGKLQLFHKKMGRRKERKKAQNSSNKKKLQKPTVNAQKLQFCKLQKKYAPRATVVHNLIAALSYYLHTKSSTKKYTVEKIVLVENQKINGRCD